MCEPDVVCLWTFIGKQFCFAEVGLLRFTGGVSRMHLVDITDTQCCIDEVGLLSSIGLAPRVHWLFCTMGTALSYALFHESSVAVP